MPKLDVALKIATKEIDQCVAAGYVDISTGSLLGVHTTDQHPNSILELVAAATGDLFSGENINTIENTFKSLRKDTSARKYFQEIIVNSENLIHIFLRSQSNQNHVGVFVCRNKVTMGFVLQRARIMMNDLEKMI